MSNRTVEGRSFHDQPEQGWLRKRVIMSCDASRGPLLTRFHLVQTPWLGVYLHHLQASDEDRALHDHPWSFITFLMSGGYFEHTPPAMGPDRYRAVPGHEGWWHVEDTASTDTRLIRHYGPHVPAQVFAESNARDLNAKEAREAPSVRTWRRRFSILYRPAEWQHRLELVKPTWTLVIRFRRYRAWGFITRRGWQHWREYGREWCD